MSIKAGGICRKFSLCIGFLLLLQVTQAQNNFGKVDKWLKNNLEELGGRAFLMIYKDGKIVYSKAENGMSNRQKMTTKFIAKRQGKDASKMQQDFTATSRERIVSCSKWLSAALVMTFVDEGKLSLEDTVGKYLPIMTTNGKGNIKIWQFLSHLTGIKSGTLKESMDAMKNISSMDEAMEKLQHNQRKESPVKHFITAIQVYRSLVL